MIDRETWKIVDEMQRTPLEFVKGGASYKWDLLKMASMCSKGYCTVQDLVSAAKFLDDFVNPKPVFLGKKETT